MKKVMSLLLAVMMVLSMSACGGNETTIDNDTGVSTTQNQTDVTDTSSTEQSTDTTSSDIDNNGNTDDTDVSSSTTSKPTTTTKPETTKPSTPTHTHSYSNATCTTPAKCSCGETKGSSLGHKWQDATCKAPKTCSVCRKTEGSIGTHVIENGLCKFCAKTIVVSPKNLDTSKTYLCVIERGDVNVLGTPLTDSVEVLYLGFLSSSHGVFSNCGYYSPINIHNDDACEYIFYKDKKYFWYLSPGGFVCEITYEFTDEEIIMRDTYEPQIYAKLNVLSDGSIKVVSKTDDFKSDLKVGMIFKPMAINNSN